MHTPPPLKVPQILVLETSNHLKVWPLRIRASRLFHCFQSLKLRLNLPQVPWLQVYPRNQTLTCQCQVGQDVGKMLPDRFYTRGTSMISVNLYLGRAASYLTMLCFQYDPNQRCDLCGRGSDFGFFYRCVHNVDTRLFENIAEGNQVNKPYAYISPQHYHECALIALHSQEHFDEIGAMFSQQLKAPVRGAAARQDKLSPLKEMTHQQLETYTAPQLATVLRQHEDSVVSALAERHGPFIPHAEQKPYLEPLGNECMVTVCSACGRGGTGEDMSFLSIDGVLKGDIPPSAAVGYGFRGIGGRPVANANIVKNLGLQDPKTGQLPHHAQKTREERKRKAAKILSNTTEVDEATTCKMLKKNSEPGMEALVDVSTFLNMDDEKASAAVEPVELKAPANNFAGADDSNEDVIQFYVDWSKNITIVNGVLDAEGGANKECVSSVRSQLDQGCRGSQEWKYRKQSRRATG